MMRITSFCLNSAQTVLARSDLCANELSQAFPWSPNDAATQRSSRSSTRAAKTKTFVDIYLQLHLCLAHVRFEVAHGPVWDRATFLERRNKLQSTDCDKRSVGLNNYSFVIRSKSTWLLIEECWTASVLRSPLWISTSCQLQEVSTAAGAGAPQPGGILQKPQCVASQSWVNIFSKPRLHKTFERMTPEFCTCHAESLCSVFHQTFLKGTLNSVQFNTLCVVR